MNQYICTICGYIYDEEKNGKWDELPDDWKCPICGAGKDAFKIQEQNSENKISIPKPDVEKELSPMEMSIICSNLARGCEKQYMTEQMKDFKKLSDFFRSKAEPEKHPDMEELLTLIEKNLNEGYPYGNYIADEQHDRGALRSLVWSEKVTRMLQSLINRYKAEGDKMLDHTGVYVCTVCGFVYVGNASPEICPVCKVPVWKFEQVKRRSSK